MSEDHSISSESEYESEAESVVVDSKAKPKTNLRKDGRPKRIMTPLQLEKLALAREKAKIVIQRNKKMKLTEKELKKEKLALKQLELDKELKLSKQYKLKLMEEAGIPEPKKKSVAKVKEEKEDKEDTIKMNELNEQLDVIKKERPTKKEQLKEHSLEKDEPQIVKKKKKKKKVVVEVSDSESESESESEDEVVVVKKKKKAVKKQVEKVGEIPVKEPINEVVKPAVVVPDPVEEEKKRQIRLLFPDF